MRFISEKWQGEKEKEAMFDALGVSNGFYGYRGSSLGDDKEQVFVNTSIYGQEEGKWRTYVNLPDPFTLKFFVEGKEILPILKEAELIEAKALYKAIYDLDGDDLVVERFISSVKKDLLLAKFVYTGNKKIQVSWNLTMPSNMPYGNPYQKIGASHYENGFDFIFTVEDIKRVLKYRIDKKLDVNSSFVLNSKTSSFVISVSEEGKKVNYDKCLKEHIKVFEERFNNGRVLVKDEKLQEKLDYCLAMLLMAINPNCVGSLSARGSFCLNYKGATFWDSEMFVEPLFMRFEKDTVKAMINYRISSLENAKLKAKKYGHYGAFYSWESQEEGKEACSEYNVTDPITGKGIRTYFVDKQVHISFDVAISILKYIEETNDKVMIKNSFETLYQICLFALSLASEDEKGIYHIKDVIGPDEYHERIDDDFYTNYLIKEVLKGFVEIVETNKYEVKELQDIKKLSENIYIPQPVNGVYEQFKGYFDLEDIKVEDLKSRMTSDKEYWGEKASKTQIIKQADVIALLGLFPEKFDREILLANYDYYALRTEHGSSLSSSMYGKLAKILGKEEDFNNFLTKSIDADFDPNRKLYAGGIYIGGNHIASYAGSLNLMTYEPYGEVEFKRLVGEKLTMVKGERK